MNIKKENFKLTITHYKILDTIYCLNEKHLYPLHIGVGKILNGAKDDETLKYSDLPTYGTLISYGSKKLSRYIMMLTRYHYLGRKYDPKTNELYLEITPLGISNLLAFRKKHKNPYKKKEVEEEVTIVYIP